MDIDSDKTKALYQLSLDKTFSKASISLGISQPALSKKIARLEDEMETALVIRNSRGVQFTEFGHEVIKYYNLKKDLDLELLSKLSADADNGLIGELNIATYSSIGRSAVLPCLSSLSFQFPKLKVRFLIKELRELENCLLSGEANFILSNKKINRENVLDTLIGEEEIVHITPKNKKFSEFFLDHDQYDQSTFDFFKLQNIPFDFQRNYFYDIYGIIDAVKLGYGQAVTSKHLIKNDSQILIKKHKKRMFIDVYLSYFDRSYLPKIHKKVIDLLVAKCKDYL